MKTDKKIYIVVGEDAGLKKEELLVLLREKESGTLENVHFYANDSTVKSIEQEISNMSFTARVFIFHHVQSFKKDLKTSILSILDTSMNEYFIFDYGEETEQGALNKDAIYKKIKGDAQLVGSPAKAKENVFFDLVNAIRRGDLANSLKYVQKIVSQGGKKKSARDGEILKLLKGLTTMLSKTKSSRLKRSYLQSIFKTDRLLKESVVDSQIALERLIVDLTRFSKTIK